MLKIQSRYFLKLQSSEVLNRLEDLLPRQLTDTALAESPNSHGTFNRAPLMPWKVDFPTESGPRNTGHTVLLI
jgi:hypothetical protein